MPLTVSRCIRCLAIGTLLLASCPDTTSATSASLRGTVTGPDDAPLAETRVVVESLQSGVEQTLTTDRQGRFGAENLPPGIDYEILVGNDRGVFTTSIQDRVVLRAGQVTFEPFQLEYTIHYRVDVRGRRDPHIVNLREVGNRTVYDHNFIKGLPVFCGF
jgi:hypothetical protein